MNECPPVMICGFNRPDCLARVFEKVRKARPSKLFLVLDAPREGRPSDVPACEACRKIFDGVDWPCDVKRNYAERNMGCRDRMETGITWVFQHVDRAIILEDGCVPDDSFFRFCGELLEQYKDDSRIGMICGHWENLSMDRLESHGASYYFDRFASIWGWATWKRAWDKHDPQMGYVPELDKQFDIMEGFYHDRPSVRRRRKRVWGLYHRTVGAWDGAWFTTVQIENWLCIHPYRNLVSNIGSDISSRVDNAGKTGKRKPWDALPTQPMEFPLKAPLTMMPDPKAEKLTLIDCYQLHYRRWWLSHLPSWVFNKVLKIIKVR